MTIELLPDGSEVVEPFIPVVEAKHKGGRPRVADRVMFHQHCIRPGVGFPWEILPHEMGCGSAMRCWRRLCDWQERGVWQSVHFVFLDWLVRSGQID